MPISNADYIVMQARLVKNAGFKALEGGEKNERDLHEKIAAYCKTRRWIVFHGSMAHRTHRSLGEPDFIILANDGRVLLVECKSQSGKLSVEQLGIQLAAKALGHTVHAVRSLREFIEIVKKIL